ncbi:MAG: hypothetical protein ACIAQF_06685 [Phycisphaerales bacterium JB065]
MKIALTTLALATGLAAPAIADINVTDYEDLAEGFYGEELNHNGVTYRNVNNQAGVFPDGSTFDAGDLNGTIVVEDARVLYNDFPDWGSPVNCLTFGGVFIPGSNVSLGALSTVTMDLDSPADSASLELAYYENGPWGGIEYRLDAMLNGEVVASDSFTIANLGGRDNVAFTTMSVDGAVFDSLHLYATYNGEYSAPRGLVDNLAINSIPAPASVVAFAGLAGLAGRRRR